MANGDYGYFGKGDTGYAQYMTAFNRNFGGSSGGGGGGDGSGSGCGCLIAIAVVVVLVLIGEADGIPTVQGCLRKMAERRLIEKST